ncbi:PAS domain S-box protein [Desulfobacula sp.]
MKGDKKKIINKKIEQERLDGKISGQIEILEKILECSPVGICLVENRIFKWVNNEMLKIFGYEKKQDFENADVQMIYNSYSDFENAGKIIYHDLKDKGKADFDFDLKKKDGSLFKAHIIITSTDTENSIESTIVILEDISQREAAQKEKLEKEKLQGVLEMAGAVCHEINQPLQTIIGYSTLYQEKDSISSRELHYIKAQATRIGNITKRLSNITQYKTINYPGNTKIVDIWGSSNDSS